MSFLDKMEKKFGKYAIPNITRVMVILSFVGYIFYFSKTQTALELLQFSAGDILKGQVWRLVSWILIPYGGLSIWAILFMVCLLSLGEGLERSLGSFRMNVYFLGGILLSDVVGFLIYATLGVSVYLTPYYILFSLYLMLGLFMPDAQVALWFVLPIRMKWLMVLYGVSLAYEIFNYFFINTGNGRIFLWQVGVVYSTQIVVAIVNLMIFVKLCSRRVSFKQKRRQQQFHAQTNPNTVARYSDGARHRCAVCGKTEKDDPGLEFRYCSKCAGNYEYCQEHLFTHEHRKR